MFRSRFHSHASLISIAAVLIVFLFISAKFGDAKPVDDISYMDTEEILTEMDNNNSYETDEASDEHEAQAFEPNMATFRPHLPTHNPIYFPNTDIELGSLFEQVGRARRKEVPGPVDLPVPYIMWTRDDTGEENKLNYWKRFYNSMYKVD